MEINTIKKTNNMEINTNGHAYVDLGLPSGTLWAKMNVGAKKETDYGLYFAWGETQGYTASQVGTDKQFDWKNYAFRITKPINFTKYDQDGLTNLELTDDAASVNMGGDWHMPTKKQCVELLKKTKNGFVTNAGIFTQYAWSGDYGFSSPTSTTAIISGWDTAGYIFFKKSYTSVTEAIRANDYLFIPAAGYCCYDEFYGVGECSVFWSSSLDTEAVSFACHFGFDCYEASVYDGAYRYGGKSVRGVISK